LRTLESFDFGVAPRPMPQFGLSTPAIRRAAPARRRLARHPSRTERGDPAFEAFADDVRGGGPIRLEADAR
jgi:hypothetical protein